MAPVFRPRDRLVMRPTPYPLQDSIVHVDVRISDDHYEPLLRQVVSNEGEVVVLKHFYPESRVVELARADVWFRGRFIGFCATSEYFRTDSGAWFLNFGGVG